ncbi:hypothetical protein [Streptomyces sp. NPDC054866]
MDRPRHQHVRHVTRAGRSGVRGATRPGATSPDSARPNVEFLTAADRAELLADLIEALRDIEALRGL